MPAPYNRQRIIDHLVTTISASGIMEGSTTMGRVDRALLTADDVGATEFPACCVVPAEIQPPQLRYPFGDIRTELDVWIIAHARAETAADKTAAASNLERNIRVAIEADQTRGGYAIMSIETDGMLSDEGWPDMRGLKGGTVTVALKFRITYYPNDGGA